MLTPRYKTKTNFRIVQSSLCMMPSPFVQFLDPIYPFAHHCKFILRQPLLTRALVQTANRMQALHGEVWRRDALRTRHAQCLPTQRCTTPPPSSNTHSMRPQISNIQAASLAILRPTHTHATIPAPMQFYNCRYRGQDAPEAAPAHCSGAMECCPIVQALSSEYFHLKHCIR